ncbi:unnamed protein product [Lasius platythorax]|uniref:Uncharacterized protein n=1 Tax=Lasius platythorax TaxID=488582 RepID=A0AAV2NAY2_9HYME
MAAFDEGANGVDVIESAVLHGECELLESLQDWLYVHRLVLVSSLSKKAPPYVVPSSSMCSYVPPTRKSTESRAFRLRKA